jgi:SynChlorMet cassette radical SAM/SPASM protein ScmE
MMNPSHHQNNRFGLPAAPASLDISLTGKCNLRCRYCFYADEMVSLSDLPTKRWLEFFAEAGGIGVQRVTLSGGELFTRPDVFALVDGVIENRMRYSLLTNGTLIDEKIIDAFGKGKRRLRLDSVQVSIDGSKASVHDLSRPPASFDRALRGLRLLKENDFPVTCRVTINRHNVHDLAETARLLLDDVGLKSFGTNSADRFGSARCYGQDVVLSPEEWAIALKTMDELVRKYPGRINAAAGPQAFAKNITQIEEAMAEGKTGLPRRGKLAACGGVFTKMAILHDGAIVPCNMLPTMVMGKIGSMPLQEAWLAGKEINILRERYETPITTIPGCENCRWAGFCTGGCPAIVFAQHGTLNAVDQESCYKKYLEEKSVSL